MPAAKPGTSTDPTHRATFAVVGDPHFVVESSDPTKKPSSHLRVDAAGALLRPNGATNPWEDLNRLVRAQGLTADAVLCAGDLCVGGDPTSLKAGWHHLNLLRDAVGASDLFAATGNHDVRSRSNASTVAANPVRNLSVNWGPFEKLKSLVPPYPVVRTGAGVDEDSLHWYRTKYFGDGLVMVTNERYRILTINSCAEHTADPFSNERGTYPQSTKNALNRELMSCTDQRINVAILHHPPQVHERYGAGAHDFVDGGEALIEQLSSHGHWLIVHGHKHDGWIRYAAGAGRPPTIFAAASLSTHLDTNLPGRRNQFYLLDVELLPSRELRGNVRAWNWNAGPGWTPAVAEADGIFAGCGFGCRETPERLAQQIADAVVRAGGALPIDWHQIAVQVEDLKYLPPDGLAMTTKALGDVHGLAIDKNPDGSWHQVAQSARSHD